MYCPQEGQTWWDNLREPQLEHSMLFTAVNAWCERRMLRRDLDVFFLGTAIIHSPESIQLDNLTTGFNGNRLKAQ